MSLSYERNFRELVDTRLKMGKVLSLSINPTHDFLVRNRIERSEKAIFGCLVEIIEMMQPHVATFVFNMALWNYVKMARKLIAHINQIAPTVPTIWENWYEGGHAYTNGVGGEIGNWTHRLAFEHYGADAMVAAGSGAYAGLGRWPNKGVFVLGVDEGLVLDGAIQYPPHIDDINCGDRGIVVPSTTHSVQVQRVRKLAGNGMLIFMPLIRPQLSGQINIVELFCSAANHAGTNLLPVIEISDFESILEIPESLLWQNMLRGIATSRVAIAVANSPQS